MGAIVELTLRELARQRTLWGFAVIAAVLALPALIRVDIPTNNGLLLGNQAAMGLLSFAQFVALILTFASMSTLVSADRERGTLLLLVTKPLSRPQILVAKWLGGAFMLAGVWLVWGAIASISLGLRFGSALYLPVFTAFLASALASWLIVAFCLFLSCVLPASAGVGLGMLAWLFVTAAPNLARAASAMGYELLGKVLDRLPWLLPIGPLQDAAKGLLSNSPLDAHAGLRALMVAVWVLLAVAVFARQDLAPRD